MCSKAALKIKGTWRFGVFQAREHFTVTIQSYSITIAYFHHKMEMVASPPPKLKDGKCGAETGKLQKEDNIT